MTGDAEVLLKALLALAAAIVTIGGALSVVEHVAEKAMAKRDQIADRVDAHEERLANDHRRLTELEGSNRLIMRGVMQIMSHEIDGNHTAQLKEVRDDMEQYLINK